MVIYQKQAHMGPWALLEEERRCSLGSRTGWGGPALNSPQSPTPLLCQSATAALMVCCLTFWGILTAQTVCVCMFLFFFFFFFCPKKEHLPLSVGFTQSFFSKIHNIENLPLAHKECEALSMHSPRPVTHTASLNSWAVSASSIFIFSFFSRCLWTSKMHSTELFIPKYRCLTQMCYLASPPPWWDSPTCLCCAPLNVSDSLSPSV